ncbi:MAG: PQ-loop repeat-containing protein [Ghiorsea sp.]|nr:PQ-loop repeat-containing protein [Ghiorsea sp.]MDQ7058688.1 PQ-loop repeat-containing protein [Ghiorsea sp.]
MNIDIWQVMGSIAATAFSVGFVDQLRVTWKTKNVDGLSLIQWCVFAAASGIFTAYYAHLDQWLMTSVSVFGTSCCVLIVILIFHYRKKGT